LVLGMWLDIWCDTVSFATQQAEARPFGCLTRPQLTPNRNSTKRTLQHATIYHEVVKKASLRYVLWMCWCLYSFFTWNLLTLLLNGCRSTTNPWACGTSECGTQPPVTMVNQWHCQQIYWVVVWLSSSWEGNWWSSWWATVVGDGLRRGRPPAAVWYVWSCSLVVIVKDLTNSLALTPYMKSRRHGSI
jgi:hypothetical protein